MTAPDFGRINPSPAIHNPPPPVKPASPQLTAQRIGLIGSVILDLVLAQVALALGNITILGQKPFGFLAEWGRDLQKRALDAYNSAGNAQSTANYANKQLTILTGTALASDVTGGVSINDGFSGANAANLSSASWTRVTSSTSTDGAGGGTFGPNGSGQAVWKKSGFISRRDVYRFTTALATDYQAVLAVVSTPPESPLGEDAYLYLLGRMNSAGTEFVYARIGNNDLAIGKVTAGSSRTTVPWGGVWASTSITANPGDQFGLYLGSNNGTSDTPLDFVVKQNGITRLSHSDTTSSAYGSSNLYCGVAAFAGNRFFNLTQTAPGAIDLWAAADRKPTSI